MNSWDIIFLGVLSFVTRFFHLSFPPEVIFDEAHFGLYASKYFSHQYYYDIHPPLGKMLLAIPGLFSKINLNFNWEAYSDYPSDVNFLAFRFVPAFFGSLLVILVYFFVKEMGFSRRVAFVSSFLVLFGNAFVAQSRFILLDIMLVFFIFLSLYLFFVSKRFAFPSGKWWLGNILCGLCLAAAFSIKWTGLSAFAIVWFFTVFQDHLFLKPRKEILAKFCLVFIFPLLIYFLIFACHFYLLPLNCTSNCGQVLEESDDVIVFNESGSELLHITYNESPQGNIFQKFIKSNKWRLFSDLNEIAVHYNQSDWFAWPFMIRPVAYFISEKQQSFRTIYFFGNPLVWWFGLLGVLGSAYLIIRNYLYKFKMNLSKCFFSDSFLLLMFGYLICLFPFAAIQRFMLIYHYLPALVFAIIMFAIFLEEIITMLFGRMPKNVVFGKNKKANLALLLVLFVVFASFVYFSPLTYGFPLSEQQLQSRMWIDTWNY